MTWKKPEKAWEWLLLLTPGIASVIALRVAERLLPPILPLKDRAGGALVNVGGIIQRELSVTMSTIIIFSFGVSIFFTRGMRWRDRLAAMILLVVLFSVLNAGVAFAGCVALY